MTTEASFESLLVEIIDNRGKTCPVADSGIPLIATNCIKNTTLYPKFEKIRFVSSDVYHNWFRGHPEPGDMIFVTKGSPGEVCWVPDPVDFCIAQDMVAIRANNRKVYPKYLFAALRSPLIRNDIDNMHVGTLIPHFKKGDFDKLRIPLPDKFTQEAIGDLYFTLCEKIDINRRMNETLESMARTIFKDWFVDFGPTCARAEGRTPYLAPKFWNLFPDALDDEGKPVGWSCSTLTALVDMNPESWSRKNHPEVIEYVDLANTKWGRIGATQPFDWKDAPSRAKRVLRPGDTIVGMVRPGNGSFAFVGESDLTGSTGFAVLRPIQRRYRALVYLSATAPENIQRLANLADGAAYPAVRPEVVGATKITFPDDAVISGFSALVSPILEQLVSNKREDNTLAQTRDMLLPKLMSGEIRLRESERMVEAVA